MLVCQDRECGHKERVSRLTNARCPVCHKKMELIGQKENQKFVCVCGHKESMKAFEERRKREGAGVSKKDVANYIKKMKKEENEPVNNSLANALANLKLVLVLFFGLFAFLTMKSDAYAAFPTDMEQKPLEARPVDYGTVNVYNDEIGRASCRERV